MATQTYPSSGALWLENWFTEIGAILTQSTQEALYPSSNLLNPLRSKTWRTTSAGSVATADFDLGENKTPSVFGLIDVYRPSNTIDEIQLWGCDNSSFTDSPSGALNKWIYGASDCYDTDGVLGGILKFYLGDDEDGNVPIAQRYWRIQIEANGSQSYHELGTPWLGTYLDIVPQQGASVRYRDRSPRVEARGGAPYIDRIRVEREIGIDLAALTYNGLYTLRRSLDDYQGKHLVVDVHANEATDGVIKGESAYYGIFDSRSLDIGIDSPVNSELSFSIQESRG